MFQACKITIDEELRRMESLQNDLKRLRESRNLIYKLVAASHALSEHFIETRWRVPRRFHEEPRDNENEQQNEERKY